MDTLPTETLDTITNDLDWSTLGSMAKTNSRLNSQIQTIINRTLNKPLRECFGFNKFNHKHTNKNITTETYGFMRIQGLRSLNANNYLYFAIGIIRCLDRILVTLDNSSSPYLDYLCITQVNTNNLLFFEYPDTKVGDYIVKQIENGKENRKKIQKYHVKPKQIRVLLYNNKMIVYVDNDVFLLKKGIDNSRLHIDLYDSEIQFIGDIKYYENVYLSPL